MNTNKNCPEYSPERIRSQYTEKEVTALDELKALDKKVKAPARTVAYTLGTAAALILGSGMSLIMTDIGEAVGIASPFLLGLILGISGLLAALFNYPIYARILKSRRKKYASRIISLSDAAING